MKRQMNSHHARDFLAFLDYWMFASGPLSPLLLLQLWAPFGFEGVVAAEDWSACVPFAMTIKSWRRHWLGAAE